MVRKYGALIGIIAAIGTLIVVLNRVGLQRLGRGTRCLYRDSRRSGTSRHHLPQECHPGELERARLYSPFAFPGRHVLDLLRLTFRRLARAGQDHLTEGGNVTESERTPTTNERIVKWVAIALSIPVVLWG